MSPGLLRYTGSIGHGVYIGAGWWIPARGATLRLRDLRGQRTGQHEMDEEDVQLVYVWVVHRRGEEKRLRLYCEATNQFEMIVIRGHEIIGNEDVQYSTDGALCRATTAAGC